MVGAFFAASWTHSGATVPAPRCPQGQRGRQPQPPAVAPDLLNLRGKLPLLLATLCHLLLADHDGPVDRRDYLGLGTGLAALMCSGVAVSMAIVVGLATLMRRGWRIALLHSPGSAAR